MNRAERIKYFVSMGLLPYEADILSNVKEDTPYIKNLINERIRLMRKSVKKGWSVERYIGTIKARYIRKGWLKDNLPDPWQLLRKYEDRYKQQNPEYTSPWVKKQKDFRHSKEHVMQIYESRMDASMKEVAEQVRKWRQEGEEA